MGRHSFKKGDRVVLTDQVGRPSGTLVDASQSNNVSIKRDDGKKSEYDQALWFTFARYVEHDRAFQVGDWVRYEKADSVGDAKMNGKVGVITKVSSNVYPCANVDGIASMLLQANLVKIAPPEEEQAAKADTVTIEHHEKGIVKGAIKEVDNAVVRWRRKAFDVTSYYYESEGWREMCDKPQVFIIEHDQWGRVEGVGKAWSPRDLSHWMKEENGRKTIFNESKGWREVKPKRWVPVCVAFDGSMRNLKIGSRNNPYEVYFILPEGYRWKTVEIEREGT